MEVQFPTNQTKARNDLFMAKSKIYVYIRSRYPDRQELTQKTRALIVLSRRMGSVACEKST